MLVDQRESAGRLAGDERTQGLDVLLLAPGGAGHRLPRPAGGRPGQGRIALHQGDESDTRVGHREPVIGLQRGRERLLGARPVGEHGVHALLEVVDGGGGGGGDGQAVPVGKSHGETSIASATARGH